MVISSNFHCETAQRLSFYGFLGTKNIHKAETLDPIVHGGQNVRAHLSLLSMQELEQRVRDPSAITPRTKAVRAAGADRARRQISISLGAPPQPNSRAKEARGASEDVGSARGKNQTSKDM